MRWCQGLLLGAAFTPAGRVDFTGGPWARAEGPKGRVFANPAPSGCKWVGRRNRAHAARTRIHADLLPPPQPAPGPPNVVISPSAPI